MSKFTENQTSILGGIDLTRGAWYDDVASLATDRGLVKDRTTARRVLDQLIKKGTLAADTTVEAGSTWLEVKAAEEWFASGPAEEVEEDLLGVQQDVLEGTPADEVADALQEIEEEETGKPIEQVVTHTENYKVNEWTTEDGTEWTETVFSDNSRTIKRRKQVSGQWRTDYWGAEFEGDKERYTTARQAKAARAYGTFTHESLV